MTQITSVPLNFFRGLKLLVFLHGPQQRRQELLFPGYHTGQQNALGVCFHMEGPTNQLLCSIPGAKHQRGLILQAGEQIEGHINPELKPGIGEIPGDHLPGQLIVGRADEAALAHADGDACMVKGLVILLVQLPGGLAVQGLSGLEHSLGQLVYIHAGDFGKGLGGVLIQGGAGGGLELQGIG